MLCWEPERTNTSAIELLYFGYREFTAGPDRVLAQRGLGRVHHRIWYFVGRKPDLSMKELLERLAVTKQALHQPLQQLFSMDLLVSASDQRDGRRRRVRLSAEGSRLEAKLTAVQMKQLATAFSGSGAAAQRGWFAVMTAIASGPLAQ